MNTLDEIAEVPKNFVPDLIPITNYNILKVNKNHFNSERNQKLKTELKLIGIDAKVKGNLEKL